MAQNDYYFRLDRGVWPRLLSTLGVVGAIFSPIGVAAMISTQEVDRCKATIQGYNQSVSERAELIGDKFCNDPCRRNLLDSYMGVYTSLDHSAVATIEELCK